MDPIADSIAYALLAATTPSRTATRRERHVLEIARLVINGATERASGLALEHAAEFPQDAELLDQIIGNHSTEEKAR